MVGGLLLGIYAVSAWDAFLYEVVEYHLSATPVWWERNQLAWRLSRADQIGAVLQVPVPRHGAGRHELHRCGGPWRRDGSLPALWGELVRRDGALVVALMIVSVPFVLAPRPHVQYFQPLVPYLVLSVAALHGAAGEPMARARATLLLAMALVAACRASRGSPSPRPSRRRGPGPRDGAGGARRAG